MRSLAADLARALDPLAVATDAGFTLDPWQADLIECGDPRVLINAARQSGKSTATALLAVNQAVGDPGLILCASPSLRQSTELFRKVLATLRTVKAAPEFTVESATRVELDNGSRIVSLPGSESTVRGYSAPRLVLIDEAARVGDDLYAAMRPMLAAGGGRLIALSTPWGRRGWFFEAFEHGGEAWRRFRIPATESPRISAAFLAEEERELGPLRYRSEYLCEFVDDSEQLFPSGLIAAALSDEVRPLWVM
jgi:hypothetical protein